MDKSEMYGTMNKYYNNTLNLIKLEMKRAEMGAKIINYINSLNLTRVAINSVENYPNNRYLISLHGGFNGRGNSMQYLKQIETIITNLVEPTIVEFQMDEPDDVWDLKIATYGIIE